MNHNFPFFKLLELRIYLVVEQFGAHYDTYAAKVDFIIQRKVCFL